MKNKLLYIALIAVIVIGVLLNGIEKGVGEEVKTGLILVAVLCFCAYMKHITKKEEATKRAAQAEFANMKPAGEETAEIVDDKDKQSE